MPWISPFSLRFDLTINRVLNTFLFVPSKSCPGEKAGRCWVQRFHIPLQFVEQTPSFVSALHRQACWCRAALITVSPRRRRRNYEWATAPETRERWDTRGRTRRCRLREAPREGKCSANNNARAIFVDPSWNIGRQQQRLQIIWIKRTIHLNVGRVTGGQLSRKIFVLPPVVRSCEESERISEFNRLGDGRISAPSMSNWKVYTDQ